MHGQQFCEAMVGAGADLLCMDTDEGVEQRVVRGTQEGEVGNLIFQKTQVGELPVISKKERFNLIKRAFRVRFLGCSSQVKWFDPEKYHFLKLLKSFSIRSGEEDGFFVEVCSIKRMVT